MITKIITKAIDWCIRRWMTSLAEELIREASALRNIGAIDNAQLLIYLAAAINRADSRNIP